jgi:hypothetical protein
MRAQISKEKVALLSSRSGGDGDGDSCAWLDECAVLSGSL